MMGIRRRRRKAMRKRMSDIVLMTEDEETIETHR